MPDVVIDGIRYTPDRAPNLGIAVTARNRHKETAATLEAIGRHTPGVPIIVVDDASDPPIPDADIRFDTNVGIPAAKNACLEALMALRVEHLILLDNDVRPLVNDWWRPFVESPEPHLSAQFLDLEGKRKLGDVKRLYVDGEIEAWSGQRGYCLYYHRSAIEAVGGFDPVYGMGLYEHSDLANRIHARGLTTWRYASPKDSHLLIESLDRLQAVDRTPLPDRQQLVRRNVEIHNRRREEGYDAYVEYRRRNVILTCLYTGTVDPARNKRMATDPGLLKTLMDSAAPHPVVVLHDQLDTAPTDRVTYERYPNSVNVYFQRWINAHRYLQEHPEVGKVLICDGTDVEILQPDRLFDMPSGKLLIGCEHQIVGCGWMRSNHPNETLQDFLDTHHHDQLLNAGVLAGSRELVMAFLRDLISAWADIEMYEFLAKAKGNGLGDMAVFNYVAYTRHRDKLVFGPGVTTRFKAEEKTSFSLIRHK
ncbi:glycosyltransferase family 2 protein [Nocardia sp. CA-290969]|uniref:glycosyltransferase family 2 protein n=1 Tax=Nocardia sp. CA-290969 TaxID=3239986 RepID=UPI003D8B33CD